VFIAILSSIGDLSPCTVGANDTSCPSSIAASPSSVATELPVDSPEGPHRILRTLPNKRSFIRIVS